MKVILRICHPRKTKGLVSPEKEITLLWQLLIVLLRTALEDFGGFLTQTFFMLG